MVIVTVTRPDLSAEERAKRKKEIGNAAVRLVLETEKAKNRKHRTTQQE